MLGRQIGTSNKSQHIQSLIRGAQTSPKVRTLQTITTCTLPLAKISHFTNKQTLLYKKNRKLKNNF